MDEKILRGARIGPSGSLLAGVEFITHMTGDGVEGDPTAMEFAAAMLAARNWAKQEMAQHWNRSAHTGKSHFSMAVKKQNEGNGTAWKQYGLRG